MEAWSRDGGANGKRRRNGIAARTEPERDREVSQHAGVVKVVEVLAESPHSWEDAARRALEEAKVSIRHIRSLYVRDMQAIVDRGRIVSWRLDAKISFAVESASQHTGAETMGPHEEKRQYREEREQDRDRERYSEREARFGGYGPTEQWRDEQPRQQGRNWEQEDYGRNTRGRYGFGERWGGEEQGRSEGQGGWQSAPQEWHGGSGRYGREPMSGQYGGGQSAGGYRQMGGGQYGGGQYGRESMGGGQYGGGQYGQYGGGQYGGGQQGGSQYTRDFGGQFSQFGQYGGSQYGQYGRGREDYGQRRYGQGMQGMNEWDQNRPDFGEQVSQFGGAMAGRMRRMFRSPKGYKRSDERIREDVCDQLAQDGQLDPSEMEVSVANGEVTLSGTVPQRYMKWHAEQIIDNIGGVNEIHNQLRVQRGDMSSQQGNMQTGGTTASSTTGSTGLTGTTGRNQSRS
jgi:osmotically-inducible protein OsmY/flavin-binding protein dodecin